VGWGQQNVQRRIVDPDWLRLPGRVTVPALLLDQIRPFALDKTTLARISGWAQKIAGDRKIRKGKATAATRLSGLAPDKSTWP
jgi:hypothetical protein